MQIAVYLPPNTPTSIMIYSNNVISRLEDRGVRFYAFDENGPLPKDMDLYWDPTASDGGEAFSKLEKRALDGIRNSAPRVVVTQHSATAFSTPIWQNYCSLRSAASGVKWKIKKKKFWKNFSSYAKVITPSRYAKWEITNFLPINTKYVEVIHHGVDHEIFKPAHEDHNSEQYFLHVSNWQPVKNVKRLVKAYQKINVQNKPRLRLIVPNFSGRYDDPNIHILREPLSHEEIAKHYQGAYAFIFPSLVESFGLPILEAMACGCPVITSNSTACTEIAENAALLIDPTSERELRRAMETIIFDVSLRDDLAQKGLERADKFSWRKTADSDQLLFQSIIDSAQSSPPKKRHDIDFFTE